VSVTIEIGLAPRLPRAQKYVALLSRIPILLSQMLTLGKQIVVERLSKNINEQHLYEIFGQYGRIKDLDLPINRTCKVVKLTFF
jgi:hypothetical protein